MKDLNKFICENCAARQSDKCGLFGHSINPKADFCSKHIDLNTAKKCGLCGKIIIENATILIEGDENLMICEQCYQNQFNSCQGCENIACAFETDPDPIPKVVIKTIQQGGMTAQAQILNPDRVAKFCNDTCPCFSQGVCFKQSCGYCNNFKRRS